MVHGPRWVWRRLQWVANYPITGLAVMSTAVSFGLRDGSSPLLDVHNHTHRIVDEARPEANAVAEHPLLCVDDGDRESGIGDRNHVRELAGTPTWCSLRRSHTLSSVLIARRSSIAR
jgi:hypothetical protein